MAVSAGGAVAARGASLRAQAAIPFLRKAVISLSCFTVFIVSVGPSEVEGRRVEA